MSLGVSTDKIHVVFDCIDLDEFDADVTSNDLKHEYGLEDGIKAFGIFGRLVEWKGIREFVAAAQKVLAEFSDAKAFIVGGVSDGSEAYYSEIKTMVCHSRYADKFVLTGYRDDVPALMKLMDVVVHGSLRPEPFGMVIIEAMAMGKPVVAAAGGGPEDIVTDGVTGFLFKAHEKNALPRHIVKLLNDHEMARKMGAAGKERCRRLFDKETAAKEIEKIYNELLAA
jgi:glycosyltransferase involved in cell wall biosynthesis